MEDNANVPSLNDNLAEGAPDASAQSALQLVALQLAQVQGNAPVTVGDQRMVPGPDGVVVLPAGVELDDIRVSGRDLVVEMPDGSMLVIVDGAVFVPQLVLGDVEIPAANVTALLIGQEPQPAAGPPQSSGGNFALPVGNVGDAVGLGDLLPPTALEFPEAGEEEIFQFIEEEPDVIVITPETPGGSVEAGATVNEAGLPERPGEPEGSNEPASIETTTGTIQIDPGNAPAVVTINGVVVTEVGQTIAGEFGTMVITSFGPTQIGYSYTLGDNTGGDDVSDTFVITVTDSDGDEAQATLTIDIVDDVPTARDDTDTVEAGTATGNVITGAGATSGAAGADTVGADDAAVSGIHAGETGTFAAVAGAVAVQGDYGVLTINPDGSYSYARDAGSPGGVTDLFTYRLTDGDGDDSTATLTITIPNVGVTVGANATVLLDDDALAGGNVGGTGDDADAANTGGTLAAAGGDGALTFALQLTGAPDGFTYAASGDGILVQQGGVTVLTVTLNPATGAYTVTQNAPIDHAAGGNENNQPFTIGYTVTDADGDTASGTLTVDVDDDTPVAANDLDSISISQTSATGNVVTDAAAGDAGDGDSGADSAGADGGAAVVGVSSNNVPANSDTSADGGGNFVVAGQYGTLTLNANGSYTYEVTGNPLTAVAEVFTYTLTDADGDTTTATLTITIAARDTVPVVGDNELVMLDDDALTDGNPNGDGDRNPDTDNLSGTLSGSGGDGALTFSFDTTGAPLGFDYVPSGNNLLIQQGGQTVITVTLDPNTGAYTVTQNLPIDHELAGAENNQGFTLSYTVEDSNGSTAGGTLSIDVDDDTPELSEQGSLTLAVEEDDIDNSQSTGNNEDASVGADSDTGSLGLAVLPGADGPGTYSFDVTVEGTAVLDSGGIPVTSQGDAVLYSVNGNVLTGYVEAGGGAGYQAGTDRPVFTFTITDPATGAVAFTLIDQLDHAAGDGENVLTLALGSAVQFTDADGDSVGLDGRVNVAVQDDIPVGPAEAPDCDDNVTGNDPDAPVVENNLGIAIGTDEPMVVADVTYSGPDLTAGGGIPVQYAFDPATNVLTAFIDTNGAGDGGEETVFTLTIDPATGGYSFDLVMPLDGTPETLITGAPGGGGGGPQDFYLIADTEDAGVAIVSGWQTSGFDTTGWTGTLTPDDTLRSGNGYGIGNNNLDNPELMRFDFDSADADAGFDGPPVLSATFDFHAFKNGDVVYVKVFYQNPDGTPAGSAAAVLVTDAQFQNGLTVSAPSGLLIDHVEFYNADTDNPPTIGMIDLASVTTYSDDVDVCLDFDVSLTDFDGDPVDTTVHVTILDVSAEVRGEVSLEVGEASLDLVEDGDDLAAGAVEGSEPLSDGETDSDAGISFVAGSSGITGIVFADPDVAGNEPDVDGIEEGTVIDWSLADGGRTLVGQIGGQTAIILELSGAQTAAYGDAALSPTITVTLTDAFPHQDAPNGSSVVVSNIEVVANEGNGDSVTGLVDVTVNDDGPTAADDEATQSPENAPVLIDVFANDVAGADGVNLATGVALVGGSLTGTGTLDYNDDGTFTYTPGANEEGEVSFDYTITDGDGDSSTATVTITLADDSDPSVSVTDATVDEKGLADGSGELADDNGANNSDTSETATGTFTLDVGGDTPAKLEIQDKDGNWIDVTAATVGTPILVNGDNGVLTVTSDGAGSYSYSYTLANNLTTHSDTDPSGDLDSDRGAADQAIGDTFDVRATDSENEVSATDTLTITVNDDGPTASDDEATQSPENAPVLIDVFANDVAGADGVNLVTGVVASALSGTGSLIYNDDGTFTYTPGANEEGEVSFDYTITDGDGDSSTATVTITLADDSDPSVSVTDATVDEKGLADGSGELADDNDANNSDTSETATGTFTLDVGGDTPAKLEVQDKDGNWIDVTAATVGTPILVNGDNGVLTVTSDGSGSYSYSYTLANNLTTHSDTDPSGDLDSDRGAADQAIGDTFDVRATDGENEVSATDTLTITVNDDGPTAADDGVNTTEGAAQIDGNVLTNDETGADGATVTAVTGGTIGNPIVTAHGTLILNGDGGYSYTPNASVADGTVDSFTYTITDGDGDTATAVLSFTFTGDVNSPQAGTSAATVDEDGLGAGIGDNAAGDWVDTDVDLDGNEATFSGTLDFGFGTDGAGFIKFVAGSETVNGTLYTYSVNPAGTLLTANDGTQDVFTATLDPTTGAYTIQLLAAIEHPTSGTEDDLSFALEYQVYDSDSDPLADGVSGTLTVTVDDDLPTAADDGVNTSEGAAQIDGDVLANDDYGADGAGSVTAVTGGTIGNPIVTAHGTLILNGDGSYSYTPNASVADGTVDSFTYTITDADGDTATAVLSFTFTGDVNSPQAGTSAATVDEDGLGAGIGDNAAGDWVDTDVDLDGNEATFSGTLDFGFGTDGAGFIKFVAGSETVNGTLYTYSVNPAGTLLTANDGTQDVFTATLDPTTGAYTIQLLAAIEHPTSGTEDDLSFALEYQVYDSDSDPLAAGVSGTLTVTVDDDLPTAAADGESTTEGGAVVTGDVLVNDDYGADGAGSVTAVTGGTIGVQFATSHGLLTLNADGSYSYTPNASVPDGAVDSVTYTITDADGDTATATLSFTYAGDNAPTAGSTAATVDEDGLAAGIGDNAAGDWVDTDADLDGNEATFSGTLPHNYGSDTPGFVKLVAGSETVNGTLYTYSVNLAGTVLTANDGTQDVFTVTLIDAATGAYTVQLLAAIEHPTSGTEDDLSFALEYQVYDSDSDPLADGVSGTLTVTVDDDLPTAAADTDSIGEDGTTATGNVITDAAAGDAGDSDDGADSVGADVLASIAWTGSVAGQVTGNWGTLTVDAAGNYTYAVDNALVQDLDDGEIRTDTFSYTITDGDGDTSLATLEVTINGANDAPVVANSHVWMSSDPAQQTATTPSHANGYPVGIVVPTDVDGDNLTVTATNTPTGFFYWDGDSYEAVTNGTVLYQSGGVNFLDDVVYRPTAAVADTPTTALNLEVSDGTATVVQTVTAHEVAPTRTPGPNGQIGDGSGPLTSGNSHEVDVVIGASFAAALTADPSDGSITLQTNFQNQNQQGPLHSSGLYNTVHPNDQNGNEVEAEVSVYITVDGIQFRAINSADANPNDWIYNPVTGLLEAVVDFDNIVRVSNPTESLAEYLLANPPSATDQWTIEYDDEVGGNDQARYFKFGFEVFDPGDPAITVNGTADQDTIYGTSGNDVLNGIGGNDYIEGRGGNDTIDGGDGDDTLNGNDGNDTIVGGAGTDLIDGGAGTNNITPPLVLDLDGDGVEFQPMGNVAFDYDADGIAEPTAWAGRDDGILVFDANGDRVANDGSEIVFSVDGSTDLEGLRLTFDTNMDGVFDASDAEFASFGVWQDANGNGVTDAGEFKSLAELGIVSIDLATDGKPYEAAGGDVLVHGESSYTRADGTTGIVADAAFVTGSAAPQKLEQQAANQNGLTHALVAASLIGLVGTEAADQVHARTDARHDAAVDGPVARVDRGPDALRDGDESHDAKDSFDALFGGRAPKLADNDHDGPRFRDDDSHGLRETGGTEAGAKTTVLLSDTEAHESSQPAPADAPLVDMGALALTDQALAKLAALQGSGPADADADPKPAADVRAEGKLGAVLADALAGGSHDGPDIGALLDRLPGGEEHGLKTLEPLQAGSDGTAFGHGAFAFHGVDLAFSPDSMSYDQAVAAAQG